MESKSSKDEIRRAGQHHKKTAHGASSHPHCGNRVRYGFTMNAAIVQTARFSHGASDTPKSARPDLRRAPFALSNSIFAFYRQSKNQSKKWTGSAAHIPIHANQPSAKTSAARHTVGRCAPFTPNRNPSTQSQTGMLQTNPMAAVSAALLNHCKNPSGVFSRKTGQCPNARRIKNAYSVKNASTSHGTRETARCAFAKKRCILFIVRCLPRFPVPAPVAIHRAILKTWAAPMRPNHRRNRRADFGRG